MQNLSLLYIASILRVASVAGSIFAYCIVYFSFKNVQCVLGALFSCKMTLHVCSHSVAVMLETATARCV